MISAKLGHYFDAPLSPVAKKINIHPNLITVAGFIITAIASIVITRNLVLGGLLVMLGGFMDMLDGIVARTNEKTTEFGAFLDSVLDRYADAFIFTGIAWYLFKHELLLGAALSVGSLVGALLISYARARAEGIGRDCKTGIMERPERIILIIFGALTGYIVEVLWVMFFLTHVTVVQRIFHVRAQQGKKA